MLKQMLALLLIIGLALLGARAEGEWVEAEVAYCDEWVSLRAAPSSRAERLDRIPLGERVEVIPAGTEFCRCRYRGQTGYVMARYLHLAGDAPAETDIVVPHVAQFLTLRPGPDAGDSLRQLDPGERMRVLGWEGLFCRVEVLSTGEAGYVHSGYIAAEASPVHRPYDRWPYDAEAMNADLAEIGEREGLELETLAETADHRPVIAVRVGDPAAAHHILIQCAMHARELMTARVGVDLIAMLLEDFPGGIGDVCVHILPMVNPDGVAIAAHGFQAVRDAQLRASVRDWLYGISPLKWKANARGVDLNRNFDAGWEALTGRAPGPERYRGPAPHSETETRALVDYMDRYAFDGTVSLHSFGSLIYWAGGQGEAAEKTRSLAETVSRVTGYPLAVSEGGVERGGFKDWALEKAGVPSVTIEIGALDSTGSRQEAGAIALRLRRLIPALADWAKAGSANRD